MLRGNVVKLILSKFVKIGNEILLLVWGLLANPLEIGGRPPLQSYPSWQSLSP
jgi:hypothetical protein